MNEKINIFFLSIRLFCDFILQKNSFEKKFKKLFNAQGRDSMMVERELIDS